jgi:S1-C subfamily serine protease
MLASGILPAGMPDTVRHVPGDLLDLILIVLVVAFAVAGYRQGFIIGVLSFAGFIGGGAIGALFGPRIAKSLVSGLAQQALVAIVVVFVAAMIGQLLASGVGVAMRARLTWRPATVIDAVGGAAVSVISVLLIAWLIASAVAYAPFPLISRQVNGSAVLRGVDRLMPPAATLMFSDFRALLARGPYTQVFGALGAEGALSVGPPDNSVLSSRGLARAGRSVVKVQGTAPSCSRRIEGSGFVFARDHVMTNAHVVAGVTQGPDGVTQGPEVSTPGGRELSAQVVLYDPQRDIAVLYVPGLAAAPLHFARQASSGDNAIVVGYPLDSSITKVAARIGGSEAARSPDIYQTTQVIREIYSVRAIVKPGNSGGPLLAPDGRVYGVVFAAAVSVPDTGYALTASEVEPDARVGRTATVPVSTEGCDP